MADTKQISLQCPDEILQLICRALAIYALAAFPLGGSECAAVSRDAIQNIAANLGQQQPPQYSRRQRVQVKEAIEYYYQIIQSVTGSPFEAQHKLVLDAALGTSISMEQWLQAKQEDGKCSVEAGLLLLSEIG